MDTATHLSLQYIGRKIAAGESFTGERAALENFAVFRQLENVLFRVINTFKGHFTKISNDFKRSELLFYQESHHGDLRELYTQKKWLTISHTLLPIPRALQRSYRLAAEHVDDLLKLAQFKAVIAQMTTAIDGLGSEDIDNEVKRFAAAVANLFALWDTANASLSEHLLEPFVDLKQQGQSDRPARDVFADLLDIEQTQAIILKYEPYFTEIVDDKGTLKTLEQTIDRRVSHLEQTRPLSEVYLTNFHRLVTVFSEFLDAYARYLEAAQILEHGFVLSLQRLVQTR